MASALRHAARRLGGGALQQTQAAAFSRLSPAVEAQQRRLFPRFIHSESASDLPGKEVTLKNIKKKTEELYELVLKAEREYGYNIGGSTTSLKNKAIHVEHDLRGPSTKTYVMLFAGYLGLCYLGCRYVMGPLVERRILRAVMEVAEVITSENTRRKSRTNNHILPSQHN